MDSSDNESLGKECITYIYTYVRTQIISNPNVMSVMCTWERSNKKYCCWRIQYNALLSGFLFLFSWSDVQLQNSQLSVACVHRMWTIFLVVSWVINH